MQHPSPFMKLIISPEPDSLLLYDGFLSIFFEVGVSMCMMHLWSPKY